MLRTKTQKMVLCALFAALTAVLSQIVIPIGPVPINLATFAVFSAGALLGPGLGALSMAIWALLGSVGAPVFTMFRGGLSALLGPTGGYILGYIPAAFFTGLLIKKWRIKNPWIRYPLAMFSGMLTYFVIGTSYFMFSTGTEFIESMMICVVPFIPGEAVKITVATLLARRLRPMLHPERTAD